MKLNLFLLTIMVSSICATSYAQQITWQRTNGPRGGVVLSMASEPKTGRIWSGNGFYSENTGNTWIAKANGVSPGSPQSNFAMAVNDSGYLFTGNYSGSFRSVDGGDTWAPMFLPGSPSIISFAAYLNHVWAGSYGGKIFHSTDNGATWVVATDGSALGSDVYALAAYGSSLYAGTYGNGVQKSNDDGKTWTLMNTGMNHSGIESLLLTEPLNNYLLAGANGSLYYTGNGGTSWSEVSAIGGDFFALAKRTSSPYYYTATSKGFYRSLTAQSWTQSNSGLSTLDLRAITVDQSSGAIYVGTKNDGIFRSSDNGDTWMQVGTPVAVFSLAAFSGNNVLAATNDSLFSTADNGTSWQLSNTGIADQITNVVYTNPFTNKIYAGTRVGMYRSDNSLNWASSDSGITDHHFHAILATSASRILSATSGGVFFSDDQGTSWNARNSGLLDSNVYALAYDTAGYYYAATLVGGLYRLSTIGTTWQPVTGLPPGNIYSLVFVPATNTILAGFSSGDIYRSTDQGTTWNAGTSTISTAINQFVAGTDNTVYAATLGDGVVASTDNGASWKNQNSGLAALTVYSLTLTQDGSLYAATLDGGVFKGATGSTSVNSNNAEASELLFYPNPVTSGKCYQTASERGRAEIFDIRGNLVASRTIEASAELDLEGIRPGSYFIRFSTGEKTSTQTVTILK